MKNRSHFLFFYSLIIGSLILTGGCGKKTEQSAEYKVGVTLAKPSKHLFQNSIHVQGIIQPVEKAILGAKMDGVLELLAVKEGDTVKKGDLLFQIDKLNLENRFVMSQGEVDLAQKSVEAMSAQLEISKKEMEKAQTDYDRAKTLLEQEVISNDSYEKAEVNAHKAAHVVTRDQELLNYMNAQLSVKQTAKMVAEKNLRDSKGIAPFDGVITHKFKEQGEYPGSGFRTPILRMENPDLLELSCLISSLHYEDIQPGKSKVRIHTNGEDIEAVVTYRSPSIEEKSRTFEIKAELPPKTKITSGLLCNVDIILDEHEAYGLPEEAVMLRSGNRYIAYYSDQGQAARFDVEPGLSTGGFIEIRNIESVLDKEFIVSGQYFVNEKDPLTVIEK